MFLSSMLKVWLLFTLLYHLSLLIGSTACALYTPWEFKVIVGSYRTLRMHIKRSLLNYLLSYWARAQNTSLCLPVGGDSSLSQIKKLRTPKPMVQVVRKSARGQDEMKRGDGASMTQFIGTFQEWQAGICGGLARRLELFLCCVFWM